MLKDEQGHPQNPQQGEKAPHLKSSRGFAGMDRERQRKIASIGGRTAHEKGTAHEFTSEEAREAGRKGGQASGISRSAAKLRGPDQGGEI